MYTQQRRRCYYTIIKGEIMASAQVTVGIDQFTIALIQYVDIVNMVAVCVNH